MINQNNIYFNNEAFELLKLSLLNNNEELQKKVKQFQAKNIAKDHFCKESASKKEIKNHFKALENVDLFSHVKKINLLFEKRVNPKTLTGKEYLQRYLNHGVDFLKTGSKKAILLMIKEGVVKKIEDFALLIERGDKDITHAIFEIPNPHKIPGLKMFLKEYLCKFELEHTEPCSIKSTVMAALRHNKYSLMQVHETLLDDPEVVLLAAKHNWRAFSYASARLKREENVALKAIKYHAHAFVFVDDSLTKDPKFILKAVFQNEEVWQYVDSKLKSKPSFVFEALKQNGHALEHCPNSFKRNREIVLEAVLQKGTALQFADPKFRDDKEIVLAAISQTGNCMPFISDRLLSDLDVITALFLKGKKSPHLKQLGQAFEEGLKWLDHAKSTKNYQVIGNPSLKIVFQSLTRSELYSIAKQIPDILDRIKVAATYEAFLPTDKNEIFIKAGEEKRIFTIQASFLQKVSSFYNIAISNEPNSSKEKPIEVDARELPFLKALESPLRIDRIFIRQLLPQIYERFDPFIDILLTDTEKSILAKISNNQSLSNDQKGSQAEINIRQLLGHL